MLLAVQQMVDALSALNITHKLLTTMEQLGPQPQHQLQAVACARGSNVGGSSTSSSGGGSSSVRSAVECVQWQQELLLHELVQPIHGSLCQLLQELQELVGLVAVHIRSHSAATRAALLDKVRVVAAL